MAYEMRLVQEIEKHKCLYNNYQPGCNRRDLAEKAWIVVSQKTGLAVAECKEKWRNIRNILLRSLKPSEKARKPYYLAKHLNFVLPFLRPISILEYTGDIKTPSTLRICHSNSDKLICDVKSEDVTETIVGTTKNEITYKDSLHLDPSLAQQTAESHVDPLLAQPTEESHFHPLLAQQTAESHVEPLLAQSTEESHLDPLLAQPTAESHLDPLLSQPTAEAHLDPLLAQPTAESHLDPLLAQQFSESHLDPLLAQPTAESHLDPLLPQPTTAVYKKKGNDLTSKQKALKTELKCYKLIDDKSFDPLVDTPRWKSDSMRYFLVSLLPEFEEMTEEQSRIFKIKVIMILDDIIMNYDKVKQNMPSPNESDRLQKQLINLLVAKLQNK